MTRLEQARLAYRAAAEALLKGATKADAVALIAAKVKANGELTSAMIEAGVKG